jgi:large subunit ribosomal protein L11
MAKEITNKFKMVIPAGKATPAPPYGPILGQNGINIQDFCTQFNARTAGMGNVDIPVVITVFKDRTFKMDAKQPTTTSLIRSKINIEKGSAIPNKNKVGKIKIADIREIAEKKLEDLNTKSIESAMKTIEGAAKSMGVEVIK